MNIVESTAPVGYTCPDIDKIKNQLIETRDYVSNTIESLKQIEDQLNYLTGRLSPIEDLRQSNKELRKWGEKLECENNKLKESNG